MDKTTSRLEFVSDSNGKEYKVKAICDRAVYAKKSEDHLPGLNFLVSWKDYPKKENTWEPTSVVLHLRKLISNFYYNHSEKSTATFQPIDSALPIARHTIKPRAEVSSKQK